MLAVRLPRISVSTGASTRLFSSDRVKIVEVGPRDGLQNEPLQVSVDDKVELIRRLEHAGCRHIETASFVSPKWVPSMANSLEVLKDLKRHQPPGVIYLTLVPNVRGMEQAIAGEADEIAIFGSASESFSQKNIGCSIEESLDRFRAVVDMAKEHSIPIRAYLSCVIACPYEGDVSPTQVARVAAQLMELGCYELSLGDTIGVGTPGSTRRLLEEIAPVVPVDQIAVHFHDTYGQAVANMHESLSMGVRTVDAAVSGLGGCPYAKGSSGNVATEDVVYSLKGWGMETGIDLDRLVDAGSFICEVLNLESRSKVATALRAKRKTEKGGC